MNLDSYVMSKVTVWIHYGGWEDPVSKFWCWTQFVCDSTFPVTFLIMCSLMCLLSGGPAQSSESMSGLLPRPDIEWQRPLLSFQVSCCSFEDSSTMPESARWPTPCPPCRALESSSSIELTITVSIVTFFLLFSETSGLLLSNQRGRKEPPPSTLTWFGQYKIYPPWCETVNAKKSIKKSPHYWWTVKYYLQL